MGKRDLEIYATPTQVAVRYRAPAAAGGWLQTGAAIPGNGRQPRNRAGGNVLAVPPANVVPTLASTQERQIFRWINGKSPLQYDLSGELWTRKAICELVRRRCGKNVSIDIVDTILCRLGLSPHSDAPLSSQDRTDAQREWRKSHYPRLQREAAKSHAELCFWHDLPGPHITLPPGPLRDLPQGQAFLTPSQQSGIRMAMAITGKGDAFWFTTYDGLLNSRLSIELLRRLMHKRQQPLHLIVDDPITFHAAIVQNYAQSLDGKLQLHCLPVPAVELVDPCLDIW
jgi:transposase